MSNQDTQLTKVANPFAAKSGAITAAANSDSDRAIQEVQASLIIAKRFPRDEIGALDRILNACTRPTLAAQSLYSYAKGGTDISGPSIRLAEAIAQHWGNLQFGVKEIGRFTKDGTGHSEVEAFAWDLQTNVRKPVQFVVKHWRDTKAGGYALKDEREIYELVANQAARRLRSCILAIIPGDVTESARLQCEATMTADADASPATQKKIVESFKEFGVSQAQIEKVIQRRVDAIQPAQVIRLRKILLSIRDGMSNASDWFESGEVAAPAAAPAEVAAALAPRRGRPPKQESPVEIIEDAPGDSTTQEVTLVGIGVEKRTQRDGKTPYDLFVVTYNNGFADCQASTISRAIVEPVNGLAAGAKISIAVEPRNIEGESDKLVSLVVIGGEA